MGEPEIKALLVRRFIANHASADELKVFFYLLKEGQLDEELGRYMDSEKLDQLKMIDEAEFTQPSRKRIWTWKLAASVVLLIGAAVAINAYRNGNFSSIQKIRYAYIDTGRDEVKKIKLPDGSLVWLNASSKLKYPIQFDTKLRELFLEEGEAFFDVKRDEHRPFVVHAAGTETKVLGTEFNIRSYKYLPEVQVTVKTGKVSVATEEKKNQEQVLLLPNQRASFDRAHSLTIQEDVNSGNAVAWKLGRMVFDDESLHDVAAELQQKYNIPIEIDKKNTSEIRLSAEFESTDSLPVVLDALSLANNLKYELKDGKVLLKAIK